MRAIVITMLLVTSITYATENEGPPDRGGPSTQVTIDNHSIRNVTDDHSISVQGGSAEGGDATASVGDFTNNIQIEGDTIPADTTHRSTVKLENTPDSFQVTPGSGDSCKAHIGANLAIPGLGTGITIPLPGKECRKFNYVQFLVKQGQHQAAEIMTCSLKEIKREFDNLDLNCQDVLTIYVEPIISNTVEISTAEYDTLIMAQVSKEEYDDQQEMVEMRQSQQENLIDSLQQDREDDEEEIKALKAVVTKALKERDEQREIEEQKTASFAKIYSKYEVQEEEPEDEQN